MLSRSLSPRPADGAGVRAGVPAPARRPALLAAFVALALLAGACGGSTASPAPSARPDGVALVPGAAASATVGAAGGELTAADPAGGRSYRLSVPAGAVGAATEITMAPIAAIDGHPFDGGLLGGVELGPEGTTFLAPVTLVISLDAERKAALKSALDAGEVVAGFSYPGTSTTVADDLGLTLADVAADAGSVTLTLFHFSGAGSGRGRPDNLRGRPCPTDPARYAECEIHKILHPPGGPADPADPAVRDQIIAVLRDWLDVLEVVIADSAGLPEDFRAALGEAIAWHSLAFRHDLVGADYWADPADVLWLEASDLERALFAAYTAGLGDANQACALNPVELEPLLDWIELHNFTDFNDIPLPPLDGLGALHPLNFCLDFDLVPAFSPAELAEGDAGQFTFDIAATPALTDAQLAILKPTIDATPVDPARLSAAGSVQGLTGAADVTAITAVAGRDDEGEFDVVLHLLGLPWDYAEQTTTFDITSSATARPAITCSGDPTTVTSQPDEPNDTEMSILFFGGSTCRIDPTVDPNDSDDVLFGLWNASPSSGWTGAAGPDWSVAGSVEAQAPGTYTFEAVSTTTGARFSLTFTVEIAAVGSGLVAATFRDVSITPLP